MNSKKYIGGSSESLRAYLNEISRADLLSEEEERVLALRIRGGDEEAIEMLVKANLRFVVSIAKQSQYQNRGLSLSELISEGNVGLMKAARDFDITRGFKFISYAVWWIRQSILHGLAVQSRLIRLPQNKVEELRAIDRRIKELENLDGIDKVASGGLAMARPDWALQPLSLDAPQSSDDGIGRLLQIPDHTNPLPDQLQMEQALKDEVVRTIARLTPQERVVVNMYFGLNSDRNYTLGEIGAHLGLTRERIRQIKLKAIQRLRHTSGRRLATYAE